MIHRKIDTQPLYDSVQYVMIHETPDDYLKITKPFMEQVSNQRNNIKHSIAWLSDMIIKKQYIYRDEEFVLIPYLEWWNPTEKNAFFSHLDQYDVTRFHCVAFVDSQKHPHLKTLRDVKRSDLPLLSHIYRSTMKILGDMFDMDVIANTFEKNPIGLMGEVEQYFRSFIHYVPSIFSCLHLHFVYVGKIGSSLMIGRAHSLTEVFNHLQWDIEEEYYEKVTLSFSAREEDAICRLHLLQ